MTLQVMTPSSAQPTQPMTPAGRRKPTFATKGAARPTVLEEWDEFEPSPPCAPREKEQAAPILTGLELPDEEDEVAGAKDERGSDPAASLLATHIVRRKPGSRSAAEDAATEDSAAENSAVNTPEVESTTARGTDDVSEPALSDLEVTPCGAAEPEPSPTEEGPTGEASVASNGEDNDTLSSDGLEDLAALSSELTLESNSDPDLPIEALEDAGEEATEEALADAGTAVSNDEDSFIGIAEEGLPCSPDSPPVTPSRGAQRAGTPEDAKIAKAATSETDEPELAEGKASPLETPDQAHKPSLTVPPPAMPALDEPIRRPTARHPLEPDGSVAAHTPRSGPTPVTSGQVASGQITSGKTSAKRDRWVIAALIVLGLAAVSLIAWSVHGDLLLDQSSTKPGASDAVAAQSALQAAEDEATAVAALAGGSVDYLPSESPSLSAQAKTPVVTPKVDVVRIETSGSALIAGTAEPHSELIVLDKGKPIGLATADSRGEWILLPDMPLAPGDHEISLVRKIVTDSVTLPKVE